MPVKIKEPEIGIDGFPVISVPRDHGFELPRGVDQFDLVKRDGDPAYHWYHPNSDALISAPSHWSPNAEIPETLPKREKKAE